MIVAFVGVDGSGKSEVSKRVYQKLVKQGEKAKLLHIDRYFLFQPLINVLRGDLIGENPLLTIEKKPFIAQLWPLFAIADHTLRYIYLFLLSAFGYVVICDRYFYDKLLSFKYFGYTNEFTFKLASFLTLPPSLTFYLDVSPETAQKRETKDTHTSDFYYKMIDHYRELAERKKFILVNGEKPFKDVLTSVLKEI